MREKRKYSSVRLPGLQPKIAYAGRRFHAWWEGYGFDPTFERTELLLHHSRQGLPLNSITDQADMVSEAIWGYGRIEPGSPAWSMHLARSLMINTNARVGVFGAGRGAPLRDLKKGTRWRLSGFGRHAKSLRSLPYKDYNLARQRMNKPVFDGGMMLFELHRESEPENMLRLMYEMLLPGAKATIVDFSIVRKGVRLKSAFEAPWQGVPQQAAFYEAGARNVGFEVTGQVDDTQMFIPLITRGFAGWRSAWQILENISDNRQRAALLRLMSDHAAVWAERYDAMRSGQLIVTRIMVEKS